MLKLVLYSALLLALVVGPWTTLKASADQNERSKAEARLNTCQLTLADAALEGTPVFESAQKCAELCENYLELGIERLRVQCQSLSFQHEIRKSQGKGILGGAQGEWYSDEYGYGFRISGRVGRATITNAPRAFKSGDVILRLQQERNGALSGQQMFTDGQWYDIEITIIDDLLRLRSADVSWTMTRR